MKHHARPWLVATTLLFAAGAGIQQAVLAPGELPLKAAPAPRIPVPVWLQSEPAPDEIVLLELTETDPIEALRLAVKFLEGVAFDRVMAAGLEKLLKENPSAAAGIVGTLAPGDFQQVAAGRVARALARTQPAAALAWAQSLADDSARLRATREAAGRWAETDPVTASRAVSMLTSERERGLAALAVVTVWARFNAPAALAWSRADTFGETRALVLSGALQAWAERDALAAMGWLSTRPGDLAREIGPQARLGILQHWAKQDAAAARKFVSSLPDGEQASAVERIAPQLAQADPIATMQWALSLQNTALGDTAFAAAFRCWREFAPAEAQRWFEGAALTPEEKSRLAGYP